MSVGVYGATGYTGRFVAAQLISGGHHVVLGGRDAAGLGELAATLGGNCEVHPARIDDAEALRCLADHCAVVINCAGPFSRFGRPVAEAAIAGGAHYLDHTSEPAYVYRLMRELDAPARQAGLTLIAGMTFYTGLADLIAQQLAASMGPLRRLAIAYAVEGWRLTPASVATGAALANSDRVIYRDNALQLLPSSDNRTLSEFPFPLPIGVQPVIAEYQGCCESVTVPRHTRTAAVETYITAATFAGTGQTSDASPVAASPAAAATQFTVVVDAYTDTDHHRSYCRGAGDLYQIGALISVEAAELLAAGQPPTAGVLSPAEAFAETNLLGSLMGMQFISGGLHTETRRMT
ncbi:hypothetical protein A5707_15795 [Mycobacterium kyorinense]|uniref:Saccharopine dehydrogenase NADP binding domain-containing protein n=1 Tax=Mycobacterium kyorinense TaxID=487514 RepID=A0A1A2ZH82_9MYCO|nr:hypothetical protein A5707_15795 [Mycobacterium kyorinense]